MIVGDRVLFVLMVLIILGIFFGGIGGIWWGEWSWSPLAVVVFVFLVIWVLSLIRPRRGP